MSIFADLRSIDRRAVSLPKKHGLGLLARSLLLIVSLCALPLFGVGIVFAGVVIFGMCSAALEQRANRGGRGRTLAMVASGLAVVVSGVVAVLAPTFVVARASELRARTHRSAPAHRALLFGLGTLDDARVAFLARESRRLVWLGVPAALAIVAAAGAIVVAR